MPTPPIEFHNPDNLTPGQIGETDGWRLLTKAELQDPRPMPGEYWVGSDWLESTDLGSGCPQPHTTYRTKASLPSQPAPVDAPVPPPVEVPAPVPEPQWHNPEEVTDDQLQAGGAGGSGYRFLTKAEAKQVDQPDDLQLWTGDPYSGPAPNYWTGAGCAGEGGGPPNPDWTYRTKAPLPGTVNAVEPKLGGITREIPAAVPDADDPVLRRLSLSVYGNVVAELQCRAKQPIAFVGALDEMRRAVAEFYSVTGVEAPLPPFSEIEAAGIKNLIREHEDFAKTSYPGNDVARVRSLFAWYRNHAEDALQNVKRCKDEIAVFLRAMALVLDMVGNGGTHKEKDARLRGCIELIESAIKKLEDHRIEFALGHRSFTDSIFRSDYPTRELVRRIHELEAENQSLKGEPEPQREEAF